jgi:replicative DNA helicase
MILGCLFLDVQILPEVFHNLKPEDFRNPAHQHIYRSMLSLFNQGKDIDLTNIVGDLQAEGLLDICGRADYLWQLVKATPTRANVYYYIARLKPSRKQNTRPWMKKEES